MAIERVVTEGWFSRIRSAFGGIVVGLIFIAIAAILQFWNEGRTLRQQRLLDAGRAEVVSTPAAPRDAAMDGRLVHVSGEARAEGERLDPVFNQPAEGLALRRRVEMYQWRERSESKEETNLGGSKTTRTVYHYDQVWDDEPIDDSRFEERRGHENPDAFPFENETWRADQVLLGDFTLAAEVVAEIGGWKPMAPAMERLPDNLAASFAQDGEWLNSGSGSPRIGDVRVGFERIPGGPVSVVARLRGGQLQVDARSDGELLLVERGALSSTQLFDNAESRNTGLAWILRIVGFVVMWLGFGLLFAPLAVFADVLPIAGRMTRFVNSIVSGVLAATISFVAIASGWLYHRPWLLLVLVVAIAIGVFGLIRRGRAKAAAMPMPPPAPLGSPPPPPPR